MYKIVRSTDNGLDEIELDQLEKGYWLDIVAPSEDELAEVAAATGIQMDFLSAALDEEEKSRIEVEDDQILILVDIPFFRSNKDYDTLPLGIIITENGMSCHDVVSLDGQVHDPNRIDYMHRYLHELRRAAEDGVDVRGYFAWSLLDNFEWSEGYNERFGLVHVDFATGQRTPKDSAAWYAKVSATNGKTL